MIDDRVKTCNCCNTEKSVLDFYEITNGKFGRFAKCIECINRLHRGYYARNRDKKRAYYLKKKGEQNEKSKKICA